MSATRGISYILVRSKYTASPFEHEYYGLVLIDLVRLAVTVLFVVWDFYNKLISHRQSQIEIGRAHV